MKHSYAIFAVSAALLMGCQATPEVQTLVNEKQALEKQLSESNRRISQLEADKRLLEGDNAELNRVLGVLDTEKSTRVQESSDLRGQVRKFVQSQIDLLKTFMVNSDLLDYIGGELVERRQIEDESYLLVDLGNPVPRDGTMTGVAAYFTKPTPFVVKILRPTENQLVAVWESKTIVVREAGNNRIEFPVSVGIEKGDYLAYYFPETTGVGFDEGTGDTRYMKSDIKLGGTVRTSSLLGDKKKRAYSIGVFGLLN